MSSSSCDLFCNKDTSNNINIIPYTPNSYPLINNETLSLTPILPNISRFFPDSKFEGSIPFSAPNDIYPLSQRSIDRSSIYPLPTYDLRPLLMTDNPIEIPLPVRPIPPKFLKRPKMENEDELNGIGDPDPNYGIEQEWLIFQRQGDQYDRLPEYNPYRFEQVDTTYDKLPILTPFKWSPDVDDEYERLVDYKNTQELENEDYEPLKSQLTISIPKYPLKVLLQTRPADINLLS